MNALLIFAIFALASPIFGEDSAESKRQDKRGIVNLGYGGHYPVAHGLTGYSGYGGFGHGYVPSAPLYPFAHGIGHGLGHGLPAAPAIAAHGYSAPLPAISQYSHGYNHHAPILSAPWRVGYNGLHGAGYGHGVGYVNGW